MLALVATANAQTLDREYVRASPPTSVIDKPWQKLAVGEVGTTCAFLIDSSFHIWLIPAHLNIPGCLIVRHDKQGYAVVFSESNKGRWEVDSQSTILSHPERTLVYKIEYAK